ncbi:MAG: hypothetical protein RLY78_529 [Pseudomonadota bacterium]
MTDPTPETADRGQFDLLRQRRFGPFFWTQFLGAANDNLFKFAFTVLVTYQLQVAWLPPSLAGLAIGALFILPFVLFSATSGQLSDRMDKAVLMRTVKALEVAIMALAAWGFLAEAPDLKVPLLLACVGLMGLHSTLFGPAKYAYLPQHLEARELTGGNALVESGTFIAILLGNLAGGLLIALPGVGQTAVAVACLGVAVAGWATARRIPASPPDAAARAEPMNWNPLSETWRNLRLAHRHPVVFRSLLGISWMWFFGAVFLAQFPSFARDVLRGDAHVASLLLVLFSVGIGLGSLACERLSRRQVEIGLVPLGAIGMSVFAIDLWFAARGLPAGGVAAAVAGSAPEVAGVAAVPALMDVGAFLARPAHWRICVDLLLLAASAGLYSVPMYALIQLRAPASHRARIIAANNILNALFMIVSALGAGALLSAGFGVVDVFLAVGLLNVLVAGGVFRLVPEYLLRFLAFMLTRLVYRLRVVGGGHIPAEGPAVLVANHVSYVDAIVLMAASPRPVRFLMDHRIFAVPVAGWIFRAARAIPIAPQAESPEIYARAFDEAARVLEEGDLLGVFPEGAITRDGQLQPFRPGLMKILQRTPVPVVPAALQGLWGSSFSRIDGGRALARPLRRGLFSRIGLRVGPAVAPEDVRPETLQATVEALLRQPVGPGR